MKYFRLLRIQDQYPQISSILAVGIILSQKSSWIILWALAAVFLSFPAFILNELTDREDTDKYSWNPIHIKKGDVIDLRIAWLMIVLFSLAGLIISYSINLFWWGFSLWSAGMAYSLKPVRLKNVFALDILAQLLLGVVIPFLAPFFHENTFTNTFALTLGMATFAWCVVWPYQLADFIADQKAGLRGTHIILGMKNSLILGAVFSFIAVATFFIAKIYLIAPWAWIFAPFVVYAVYKYFSWYKLNNLTKQISSMQLYVRRVKPATQLLVPYLLAWFIF